MSNGLPNNKSLLHRMLRRSLDQEDPLRKDTIRETLGSLPEAGVLLVWLARRSLDLLQPIPEDSPQWADLKRRNEAKFEILKELYLLLETDGV